MYLRQKATDIWSHLTKTERRAVKIRASKEGLDIDQILITKDQNGHITLEVI